MLDKFLSVARRKLLKAVILPKQQIENVAPTKFKVKSKLKLDRLTRVVSTHSLCRVSIFKYYRLKGKEMALGTRTPDALKPPKAVLGMTVLDRLAFTKLVKVPCISVPISKIENIKKLKSYHLKIPKVSQFVELEEGDSKKVSHRLLLLDPAKVDSFTDLDKDVKIVLSENGINEDDFQEYELKLSYENWSCHDILHAVIPKNVTGFTSIGHICHFNLKDDVLQFKHLIGEVILDKFSNLKTVVNKTNTIDNTYRSFQMELMAGEPNYVTQTKENGLLFELDFSKVYWNSRLGTEHQRIVDLISAGDTVYDVFAGVGPFAVPATKKKKATVHANDLNPVSYEYLLKNVKLNKIKEGIHCYNMDGREFIKKIVKDDLISKWTTLEEEEEIVHQIHVVMNLPALAVEFLDAFKCLLAGNEMLTSKPVVLPKVYCYCFTDITVTEESDKLNEVKERVIGIVGHSVEADLALRFVRTVAPNKDMMCVTFTLTWEILMGQKRANSDDTEHQHATAAIQQSKSFQNCRISMAISSQEAVEASMMNTYFTDKRDTAGSLVPQLNMLNGDK